MAWSDSLEIANVQFAKKLKSYAEKYPTKITYPFSSLTKENLDISTSADGLFRIYSWDDQTGGTMRYFDNVFQYKSATDFKAIIDTPKSEGDYQKIYTFKKNGKSYYLAVYLFVESSKYAGNGIHIFTIENGKLADAKLIKTQSGLHDDLNYEYNFGSVVNIDFEKRPNIRFDNSNNTIYLPLVSGKGNVTKRFIEYKFTGQYFERVKN
ncbi:MAG: hypothetical protein ABI166_11120 [Mucilaginibacter sp.]